MLERLSPLLEELQRVLPRYKRSPAVKLRYAEISWDVVYGSNSLDVRNMLRRVAALTIPTNRRAEFDPIISESFKKCRDGATNADETFYFQYLHRKEDEKGNIVARTPSMKSVLRAKIYNKQLTPGGPWHIRFEITVLRSKLKELLGSNRLPKNLTDLPKRLQEHRQKLAFENIWKFEEFNWPGFMEAAERSARHLRLSCSFG